MKGPTESQFDLGLSARGLIPAGLSYSAVAFATFLGLLVQRHPVWIPMFVWGACLIVSFAVLRRIAGTKIVVTEIGVTIYPSGRIGQPRTLLFQEISRVQLLQRSGRLAIESSDGVVTWIGPFQLWETIRGTKRRLEGVTIAIQNGLTLAKRDRHSK